MDLATKQSQWLLPYVWKNTYLVVCSCCVLLGQLERDPVNLLGNIPLVTEVLLVSP